MKSYLISSVFSLSLISIAQAAELSVEEQCQALGYDTKISACKAAGSAALICPLNNGSSDMAICITDSCRGYPLYKKNGKYYYQDQSGNEIEAIPSKGQITDYMEGSFETCVAGYGDNAVTYYRVPKCKGEALYNNYFCDVGCDTEKKYPYTYHPGNTAGIVQKCVTADQTYYGYSSCNKGWVGGWSGPDGIGRCGLDDCDMIDYPYPDEPNAYYYRENRGNIGKTGICKIGGATYYRYTECNGSDFVLKGVNTSDKQGTICARKCPVTNCTNTPFTHTYPNGDTAEINDWSCKVASNCVVGDIVMYNGKEIGVILAKDYNFSDESVKTLVVPVNYAASVKQYAVGDKAGLADIPQLKNGDATTWGKIQTAGILLYGEQQGYSYPAAEYCSKYAPDACGTNSFCSQSEWYLPSYRELEFFKEIDTKYQIINVFGLRNLLSRYYHASSEYSSTNNYMFSPLYGNKQSSQTVVPVLAF